MSSLRRSRAPRAGAPRRPLLGTRANISSGRGSRWHRQLCELHADALPCRASGDSPRAPRWADGDGHGHASGRGAAVRGAVGTSLDRLEREGRPADARGPARPARPGFPQEHPPPAAVFAGRHVFDENAARKARLIQQRMQGRSQQSADLPTRVGLRAPCTLQGRGIARRGEPGHPPQGSNRGLKSTRKSDRRRLEKPDRGRAGDSPMPVQKYERVSRPASRAGSRRAK